MSLLHTDTDNEIAREREGGRDGERARTRRRPRRGARESERSTRRTPASSPPRRPHATAETGVAARREGVVRPASTCGGRDGDRARTRGRPRLASTRPGLPPPLPDLRCVVASPWPCFGPYALSRRRSRSTTLNATTFQGRISRSILGACSSQKRGHFWPLLGLQLETSSRTKN